jgi:hypothetical protein
MGGARIRGLLSVSFETAGIDLHPVECTGYVPSDASLPRWHRLAAAVPVLRRATAWHAISDCQGKA